MPFLAKLLITNLVIVGCVLIGRRMPSLAGLIATMPITTLAVLIWLSSDETDNPLLLTEYTRGVLWGIVPTALFFATALFCFRRGMSLPLTLSASFVIWGAGALVHQWLLR